MSWLFDYNSLFKKIKPPPIVEFNLRESGGTCEIVFLWKSIAVRKKAEL